MAMPLAEMEAMIGKRVRLHLDFTTEAEDAHPVGTLIDLSDEGDAVLMIDGTKHFCWPALATELVED